jgi:hypothetical protein
MNDNPLALPPQLTQLSVCIGVKQAIDARYCREDTPDTPIFTRKD